MQGQGPGQGLDLQGQGLDSQGPGLTSLLSHGCSFMQTP